MPKINLSNLANGSVAERIDMELQRVLENIADPNTDPKKARKLTVTVTLKADEKRDIANVSIQTKSTVVPAKDVETKFVLDRDNSGKVVGAELKSSAKGQMMIDKDGDVADDKGEKVPNVVDFRKQQSN